MLDEEPEVEPEERRTGGVEDEVTADEPEVEPEERRT